MTALFTVGLSLYLWPSVLWSFRIWYKVTCSACYIVSPLFLLHWFCQVVTKYTFTSETYVILLLFKFLPSNAAKKVTFEKCGTQSIIGLFWQHKRRCSTWGPTFYSVSHFLNSFPDFPLFTSLLISNDRWNLTAPFLDNSHVVLNNWSLLKFGKYFLPINKLQSILHAILTRVIYTIIFAASIECPDSTTLTGKNTP